MYPSQIEFLKHILHECIYLEDESHQNTAIDFMNNERLSKAVCPTWKLLEKLQINCILILSKV